MVIKKSSKNLSRFISYNFSTSFYSHVQELRLSIDDFAAKSSRMIENWRMENHLWKKKKINIKLVFKLVNRTFHIEEKIM